MYKNSKIYHMALAATVATAAVVAIAPADAEAAKSFSDLTPDSPHYTNVMKLVERGVISGYPDGTFKPNNSISRAHAAKIIAKALGLDTQNVTNPGFKDIPTNYPYYKEIAALANAGIINGFPDGTFKPDGTLTRGQMAKIIARAFELKAENGAAPFTDTVNSEYKEYIAALYENKVTTGTTPTTFAPLSPVTRGQLASFVVRAEEAKSATPGEEKVNIESTVAEIKDGKVVTANGTFEISEELKKVFNAKNAAALKDAKVEIVVEYVQTAKVASLNNFAAEKTAYIVGINGLTLVSSNTSFDADGYPIPSVTINANNVEISGLKADQLVIEKNLQVTLKSVEVKELKVAEGTKITLDPTATIEKLVVPEGKKPSDVIANYNEVKNSIKEIVDTTGKTVSKSTGGGGGGSSKPTPTPTNLAEDSKAAATTLIKELEKVANKYYEEYGEFTLGEPKVKDSKGKVISEGKPYEFVFKNGDTKLADIKNSIENRSLLKEDVISAIKALSELQSKADNIKDIYIDEKKINKNAITKDNYIDELSSVLNTSYVANLLIDLTDLTHDEAKYYTVGRYFEEGKKSKSEIKITFDDGSELIYKVDLKLEQ
ncbi:S-layer homology domain-containing protein [Ureibacillus thermosphaericus]|uniref:S-layer homology domain-containing protein n=1 Tax=Ureibacillus thermosphaericus TaxID=51173 RepID=UPI000BBCCCBC|nr:S-layer homology domain-containing protein [Ureibacillus thermosphaericus]